MCFSVKKIINLPVSVHVRLHDYTAGINVPADNITDSSGSHAVALHSKCYIMFLCRTSNKALKLK